MTPCVFLSRRPWAMSISQDNWHKCHKAGDKSKSMSWDTLRPPLRLAPTPHTVLMWGGSRKDHAMRPATGNFQRLYTRKTSHWCLQCIQQWPGPHQHRGKEPCLAHRQCSVRTRENPPMHCLWAARWGPSWLLRKKRYWTKHIQRKFRSNTMTGRGVPKPADF